jgi:hypothetical protein
MVASSLVFHLHTSLWWTLFRAPKDSGSHEFRDWWFVVLVDRNPNVQALFVFLGTVVGGWTLAGASAISTGLPGKYEHFKTPLGVFDHSRENPDFRAEGTKNKFGIRGYGD